MPKCPPGETYNRSVKACRTMKKRGRKAKSATRKCPPGETYNRGKKACRTQKKRGPKSKTTPMPPMPPTPKAKSKKNSAKKNYPLLPASN